MTTTSHINGGAAIVWPELEDSDNYEYEHAIAVVPYSGSIQLDQAGRTINIPLYALPQLLRAMRTVAKNAEEKQ